MKKFAGQMRAIVAGAILAAVAGTGVPLMAGDLTVIHAFGPWPDPVQAVGRLLVGSDGRLYGVTAGGGQWGGGSAYRLNQNGENFQVLANFNYSQLGQEPKSGLVQTQDGLLFGTTVMGSKGGGNLFSFGSDGAGAVVRYPFNSVTEAFQLVGDLLNGGDGFLYGTSLTGSGGAILYAFKTEDNSLTILHRFADAAGGWTPRSGVIRGADGRLYGTTSDAGSGKGGTVYAINTNGSGFVVLHSFVATESGSPWAALIQGEDGRLYGSTYEGGTNGGGVLFALETDGTGFTILRHLVPETDGIRSSAALVQGADGTLYGTTEAGGPEAHGSVFAINPDGSGFRVLHFMDYATEGESPQSPMIFGTDGRLYGTNFYGPHGGTLFAVNLASDRIPQIANTPTVEGSLNVPFTYRIAATHAPGSYSASGLPEWLTLDEQTGVITGTPQAMGDYAFTIGASNSHGSDTASVTLTVEKTPAVIRFTGKVQIYDGTPKKITVTTEPAGLATVVTYDYSGDSTPPTQIGSYNFTVVVDDPVYRGTLNAYLIIADPEKIPVQITKHPENTDVAPGHSLTLSAEASGTLPITYRWRKDGVVIPGAAEPSYTIPSATADDAGSYRVDAYNAWSLDSSGTAVVRVFDPVQIAAQPTLRTAVLGANITYSVAVTGTGPITYQWRRNGVNIAGATDATLTLPNVEAWQAGNYSVVVTNTYGSVTSNAAALTIDTTPRLINVSCRGFAGVGDDTLVMGFYITGNTNKTLLIRGVGPKLADYIPGEVVTDPRISVYRGNTLLDGNDNWDAALAPEFARMGGFPLDTGSKDAAIAITLEPGGYTVHLVNTGAVAEGLIEVYDLSRDLGSRLTNVSCRLNMKPGQLIILGTALIGNQVSVLARNIGPGLAQYLPEGASVLADPHLRVYSGEVEIAVNDDWEAATGAYFGPVGAFGLDAGSKDAAVRVPFTPGGVTIHATGNGATGGIAIIELYESP